MDHFLSDLDLCNVQILHLLLTVVPRHQTSAVSPRDIIFNVIKKLLSCCGWYATHKAVTSTQPNAPPWVSSLTPFTAFEASLLSSGHWARIVCLRSLRKAEARPPSLSAYIFSASPLPHKKLEQNFAQSIFSLLSPAPHSQHKSFPLSDLLACDWQAITISNFISGEDNKTWYHNYPQSLQSIHVHSNNRVRCC